MKRTTSRDTAATAGDAGGAVPAHARRPLRELMDDRLLDALLERSRDEAGGLRVTPTWVPPTPTFVVTL